jgi:ABC-type multidrug transport system ATPase subunit
VSTHLIAEFEGLIDEFTIVDRGRAVLTMQADEARERYQKVVVRFAADPGAIAVPGARVRRRHGREVEIVLAGTTSDSALERLRQHGVESVTAEGLTLEEIFVSTLQPEVEAV